MSDTGGTGGRDDELWAAMTPDDTSTEAPASPGPVEPDLTLRSETEVRTRSGIGGRAVAGIVGVLLLVGGAVFAVTQIGSGGASSPEEAVDALLDAASDEDVLGLLAALDPGERAALEGPVEDLFGELERLEVLDDSFELSGVEGFDFEFADVTYRTQDVRDGLARVYLTGGTFTAGVEGAELPIGSFVADTVERFGGDVGSLSERDTNPVVEGEELFLVAREGDDGWRVSVGYTIAEYARESAGQPVPTGGVEPVGADSPEAAVEGMVRAAAELDARGVIARLSPDEMGVLQEYSPLFLPGIEAAAEDGREMVDIEIDRLELRSEESDGRAVVFVDDVAFRASIDDGYLQASVAVDGDCVTLEGDLEQFGLDESAFDDGPVCGDDLQELGTGGMGAPTIGGLFSFGVNGDRTELDFPEIETPELGVTATEVDGQWFVAPVASGLDSMVAGLRVLERSHLDAFVEMIDQFRQSVISGFEESFEGSGTELGGETTEEEVTETTSLGSGEFDPEDGFRYMVDSFTAGDAEASQCVQAELEDLDPALRDALGMSFYEGTNPPPEAFDALFAALDACAAG